MHRDPFVFPISILSSVFIYLFMHSIIHLTKIFADYVLNTLFVLLLQQYTKQTAWVCIHGIYNLVFKRLAVCPERDDIKLCCLI